MRNESSSNNAESSHGRLLLPSLVMSNFAAGPITVLTALLLIDIGNTFNTSVGVAGQINTAYSVAAVIFALMTSFLSTRFKPKTLLLTGLLLIAVSALGCFLASDFIMMIAFYSLSGVGFAMISPMTATLVGEHFPLEKRANAVGWIIAGGSLVYVLGAPAIAFMSTLGDWRFPLVAFVIPVALISLLVAVFGLPSASADRQASTNTEAYLRSCKEILRNRSATACLIGDVLRAAAFVAIVFYATSFVRQRFSVPTDLASIVLLGGALCYTLGSLVSGAFVNRFGRKPSTAFTALLSGIFTMGYVFAPNLWLSLTLVFFASWFFGMLASSANSLTLEQVPRLRGTMMSIDAALVNLGSALGTVAGWLALLYFDYEGLGSVLGAIGVASAVVFTLLATDPTRTRRVTE